MKKAIGILFISLYVLAFTEFQQLLKIPYLMEHFQKHQEETPDMSFARFIRIHYLLPITEDDDFEQHQSLPFRSIQHQVNLSICAPNHPPVKMQAPIPPQLEFFSYNEINKPQFSAFDIFQPPRCA
ncbi:MAG: hypothetical protein KIT80_13420 [Chitinophagaceae bacterium]|nr:hypothetical protein [Chitinophagaceae bacterium]MCW5927908.1 hypothetical protein [Chitinophagaceae bacterium]